MRLSLSLVLTCSLAAGLSFPADPAPGRLQFHGASLDPLTYSYPPQLQATLAALGQAVGDFSKGKFEAALAHMPGMDAAHSTALADYFLLYRGKVLAALGRTEEALGQYRALKSTHTDSTLLGEAILEETRALLKLHDPASATALLDSAGLRDTAEAIYLRAQALEGEKRAAEAAALYLRVFAGHVNSRFSQLAEQRLADLARGYAARTADRELMLERAENLIAAGRNQEARTVLLKLDELRNAGPARERAQVLLAEADTNLNRLTEALKQLKAIDGTALGAKAAFLQATCLRGLNRESAFLEACDRALKEYPQSPYTEKILYSVATYFDVRRQPERAREAYQAITDGFPNGEHFKRALWKLALDSYVAGRYREALEGFSKCLAADLTPGAAAASAYWLGRCCEQLGFGGRGTAFFTSAEALANNSYYGQRAREALASRPAPGSEPRDDGAGIDLDRLQRTLRGIEPESETVPEPAGAVVHIVERARQLTAAGLLDLALAEVNRGLEERAGTDKALAWGKSRIQQGLGDVLGAITTMRRAYPDYAELAPGSLPGEIWEILFPVRHFNLVAKHAASNNLDPDLILALIRQESAFEEKARSQSNARGLMQILPATGRVLARQSGMSRYTVARLYQPETNIALGTRHLSYLLDHYGGRVELALAAYNAGDARVDRWLAEFGEVDMAEFVERIPFSETRSYVKQVLSNRAHYHLLTAPASSPAPPPRTR